MSKTKKPAQERDEMRARLAAMSSSAAAPGQAQAKRAITQPDDPPKEAKPSPPPREPAATTTAQEPAASPSSKVRVVKKPAAKKSSGGAVQGEQPVERCSVQLYREDIGRLDAVEKALRKQGLIGRSVSTSMLVRVALAVFDDSKDLSEIAQRMKELDGRGRR